MMKFFRKHTKKLLSLFMALLLIVWLGGPALQNMFAGSATDTVLANTSNGPIVAIDRQRAAMQTQLLSRLGINWTQPLGFVGAPTEPVGVLDWVLLTREAQRWGIRAGRFEAERFLTAVGLTPDSIRIFATREDRKIESIHDAVATYLAVQQVANLALASGARSEAHVRLAARDELEKVKVNLVSLGASNFVDPEQTFTDEQVDRHFNEYRDRKPQGGLRFGYLQPAQVKVQYFKIDVNEVAWNIHVSERTLEARGREYWRRNRGFSEFLRPEEPPCDDDETDQQPQEEKPADTGPEYFKSFEEAREIAVDAIRREFAETKIDDVAGWLLEALTDPWHDFPEGDDGYKVPPPEIVSEEHYASVRGRMPDTLRHGQAVTIHSTDYFTAQDVDSKASELARASTHRSGLLGSRNIKDLAFQVQGIASLPQDVGASTMEYLAVGQSHPLLLSGRGNRYIFRVIDVKPAGPAATVDEVREQVIADLQLQSGYEEARRLAQQLADSVTSSDGLKNAFESDAELQSTIQLPNDYFSPPPFARRRWNSAGSADDDAQVYVTGVGLVGKSFVARCFEGDLAGEFNKVLVVPIEESATIAVVEWVETIPLREDQYDQERQRIARQLNSTVLANAASEWLNPVRIKDRNGWSVPSQ
ncbi:MAG: hypothetical protein V3W34_12115 [Phycisphaerae bacterium]